MLSLPPFAFANEVDNLTGTPVHGTPGTNFTANANNADGASVSVLSALAFDVHYLVVALGGLGASTVDSSCLCDVLTDPAGGTSWSSMIDDLVCGFTPVPAAGASSLMAVYAFPVWIASGTSIGVRARTAHTSNITTGRVCMWAYGNPSRPDMWWCGQGVSSIGTSPSTSKGTSVTPGNSGAAGTWTNVGNTVARSLGAIQFGLNGSDSTMLGVSYYWQIGVGSAKLPGSPTFYHASTTGEVMAQTGWGSPIWCDIPAGTQMQVMGTCSGTAEAYTVTLYGVY